MNKNREKKLIKNTLIYAIGNFSSKFIAFLMVSIYTRYLSQSQLGTYDLIITVISLIIPIITLQINDGMYRYVLGVESIDEIKKVITNSVIITVKGITVFTIVFILCKLFINFKFASLIYFQVFTTIVLTLYMYIARAYKKNGLYALGGVIKSLLLLVFTFIIFEISDSYVEALFIINILSSSIVIIFMELKLKLFKTISFKYSDSLTSKNLLKYSVPLIVTGISWWIMNLSDRFMLNYYIGIDANGLYAVANKFPSLLVLINQLFYLAWQETSILEYNSDDRDEFYSNMFNYFMIFQLTSTMVIITLTKLTFFITIGSEFQKSLQFTPFLFIATVFSAFASFYGTSYQTSKNTKGAFNTAIIGAFINILVNILLIPRIGVQGASISTALGFLTMWVLRIKGTKKLVKININNKYLVELIGLLSVMIVLFYIDTIVTDIVMLVISIFAIVFYNKILLVKLVNTLKNKIVSLRR